MKAIVQRVSEARVEVGDEIVGEIEKGLLIYVGVRAEDVEADAEFLARKVRYLRIFPDADDKMNLDVNDVGGAVLIVSNFTLYGDARKGRRPSYAGAAAPDKADALYQYFCEMLLAEGLRVERGRFQASMRVTAVNAGPINLILKSES